MARKHVAEWKEEVIPVLESKLNEWKMNGYQDITIEDLWNCLMEKVWHENPDKRLYEVVQDIFHLSIHTYMTYMTTDSLAEEADEEDLIAQIQAVMQQPEDREPEEERE